jgi:beta-lactamase regulating signal transducer with metallopeptidase domain
MIPYILHVSILIAAGFLFYKLLLKKLTFYVLNRWILLSCLVTAFVLPLLPIPRQWSWREWSVAPFAVKEPVRMAAAPATVAPATVTVQSVTVVPPADVRPASVTPPAAGRKPAGTSSSPSPRISTPPVLPASGLLSRVLAGLFYLYLFGVVILALNMIRQMFLLLVRRYKGAVIRDGSYRIITTAGIHSPCSFGNMIFIQPRRYDPDTYQQILLHEKVHAGGWHTVDIFLAELGIIFQWFNPFIWMLRREMENNLEFLTDRRVLQHPGVERSVYQLSLVKVAAPDLPLSITSNYNQSLLKRRIIMMNAQNSARHTVWKYFFLLPLFIFLASVLNRPAALAQSTRDHVPPAPAVPVPAAPAVVTHVALPSVNAQPATAAQPVVAAVPQAHPMVASQSVPAVELVLPVDTSRPSSRAGRMEGSWFITNYKQDGKDKVTIDLRDQDDDRRWNSNFSVPRSKLNLNSVGKVEFDVTREAGNMHFTGQFDGEQGFGHYKFQPDAGYLARMREKKIVVEEDELLSFFMLDINKGYVDMLQANGFPNISKDHLIAMSALGVDEAYIRGVRNAGYADISEDRLITFKALHIDEGFINDLRKSGYDHLSADNLITFKSLKIDGAYLRSLPASTPPQDIITYKSLRIDSNYVASIRQEGYADISPNDIVTLRSLNVRPEFIRSFHDIGYKNIPVQDLISLKSLGIAPEYIKGFMTLGYKDISMHHLTSLKSLGITPEFVKGFNDIGFKNISLDQLTSLKATGVTPAYVSKMKEKGLISDDLNKYIRLKTSWE